LGEIPTTIKIDKQEGDETHQDIGIDFGEKGDSEEEEEAAAAPIDFDTI
jgi:hypothetical protein